MSFDIFIGYDDRQAISYNVCQFSLIQRASFPLSITPLILEQLPLRRRGLTPFTYSRFLVPFIKNYEGWALFMDSDIIAQDDICDLWQYCDPHKAVIVAEGVKEFERAAVMLFNCGHIDNKILTPNMIESGEGFHQIKWTKNIGFFPERWNHCVGYAKPRPDPGLVHYTMGVPAFAETADCEHQDKWIAEARKMTSTTCDWNALMGGSIHAIEIDGRKWPRYVAQ